MNGMIDPTWFLSALVDSHATKRQKFEEDAGSKSPLQALFCSPLLDPSTVLLDIIILGEEPSSLRRFAQTSTHNLQFVDKYIPYLQDMIFLSVLNCDQILLEKMYNSMKNGSSRCFMESPTGETEIYPSLWNLCVQKEDFRGDDILYPYSNIKSPWLEVDDTYIGGWVGFPETVFCPNHCERLFSTHSTPDGKTYCADCVGGQSDVFKLPDICSVCHLDDRPAPFQLERFYCPECFIRRPLAAIRYNIQNDIGIGYHIYEPVLEEEWNHVLESGEDIDNYALEDEFLYLKEGEYGVRVFANLDIGPVYWNFVGR